MKLGNEIFNVQSVQLVNLLRGAYADRGVEILSIHGYTPDVEAVRTFIKEKKVTFPVAIDSASPESFSQGRTFDAYSIYRTLYYAAINRDGTVSGYVPEDSILEYGIQYILKGRK